MNSGQVHNLQNSKAQNDAEARKKVEMISNRLDSGDDFATMAMNYSEDPDTSNNGGDLGMVPESQLTKNPDPTTREVAAAVMKLKPGTVLARDSTDQSGHSSAHRVHDCEADCEGAFRAERLE